MEGCKRRVESGTSTTKRRGDDSESDRLSRLPKELRWMIIDLVPKSTGNMKTVCKSWKAIVDDWVLNQPVPDVERIIMRERSKKIFTIEFGISKSICLRFRHILNAILGCTVKASYRFWDQPSLWYSFESECPRIKALSDMLKMNVDHLSIEDARDTEAKIETQSKIFFDTIRRLLKNSRSVKTLAIDHEFLRDKSANLTIDLVKALHIQELEYNLFCGYLKDPRPYLLEIASNVKKITICQMERRPFLGSDRVNWVELITAMFNRGANEIYFKNLAFPWITSDELQRLIENLATTAKQLVFHTSLFEKPEQIRISGCELKWTTTPLHGQFRERFDVEFYKN